jgi:hypothetical protein
LYMLVTMVSHINHYSSLFWGGAEVGSYVHRPLFKIMKIERNGLETECVSVFKEKVGNTAYTHFVALDKAIIWTATARVLYKKLI